MAIQAFTGLAQFENVVQCAPLIDTLRSDMNVYLWLIFVLFVTFVVKNVSESRSSQNTTILALTSPAVA